MYSAKLNILLIEDNPGDVELIRELLGGGCTLAAASRLDAGLTRLAEEHFDAVLLDLGLPDSSGIETLQRLQAARPLVAAIVLTGLADSDLARQAIAEGAQDYLVKGKFESDLLYRSILYAIERQKTAAELQRAADELEQRVAERTAELEQARNALHKEREFLKATLDQMPVSVIITEAGSGRLLLANREVEQWWAGAVPTTASFADYESWRLEHLDGRSYRLEEYPVYRALTKGEVVNGEELRVFGANGRSLAVAVHAGPIRDKAGRIVAAVVTLFDISSRKAMEEALYLREQEFEALAEKSPDVIIRFDRNLNHLYVNPRVEQYVGIPRQELLGRSVAELGYLDKYLPAITKIREQVLATGDEEIFELDITKPDGKVAHLEARIVPEFNKEGGVESAIVVTRDLTARREAERALEQYAAKLERVNKDLQEFVFVASHDLQEPLRKITTFSGLIFTAQKENLDEKSLDYLERLHNAAGRMQALLDGLLRYSRVTTKAVPLTAADLTALAQEAVSDLELMIESKGASVTVGELPTAEVDRAQFRQLIQNLVANGLTYNESEHPEVKISGERNGNGFCRILVQDNGIGFEEKYLGKIFQPFQRLHGRSSPYPGTGMGLAICKKIVERHRGTITASSAPGQGATFIVTLPVKQPTGEKQ